MNTPMLDRSAAPPTGRSTLPVGAVAATCVAIGLLATVGGWLTLHGVKLHLNGGLILRGSWEPRLSWLALLPIAVAAVFVWSGPGWADRLPWRRLLVGSGLLAAVWAVALAVTGGLTQLAEPLTSRPEYLTDVHRVHALRPFLETFTHHILGNSDGFQWAVHVSGHPPGALLVFVGLARIGLGAPGWAAALCIATGSSAVPAVLSTLRLLGGEHRARAAAPFLVLAPAALWIATSADALFLGVSAWGVCALAHAGARRGWHGDTLALAGGLLLGSTLFLSYGLTLIGLLAVAVVAVQRGVRPLAAGALGVALVVGWFAAHGFWWPDGLTVAGDRVREGSSWIDRPTAYFAGLNLATTAIDLGPAGVGALALLARGSDRLGRAIVLPAAVLSAIALAIASNLSKGETERIYLPFAMWALTATALLPAAQRRRWLAAQAVLAVAIQLTIRTEW